MKDVIYAGFAQISYLNWYKLGDEYSGTKLKEILRTEIFMKIQNGDYKRLEDIPHRQYAKNEEDKKTKMKSNGKNYYSEIIDTKYGKITIYNKRDARMVMLYSEDEEKGENNPKFDYFKDWEFLCASNHPITKAEAGSIITDNDSGFQACAFKKGNEVIIAYRGSDDMGEVEHLLGDWILTNVSLGMGLCPDALICAVEFYEKVKKNVGENATIYLTGHSMGGALAQFIFVYSNSRHKTVTWNGLGVGDSNKGFYFYSLGIEHNNLGLEWIRRTKFDLWDGNKWTSKCENVSGRDVINEYMKQKNTKATDFQLEDCIREIEYKLKLIYRFQENYEESERNSKCKNYYMDKDLTPNLQKRIGRIYQIDLEQQTPTDTGDSGLGRKGDMAFLRGKQLSAYHSVVNFIPFMNDEGNIQTGKISDVYMLNAIKTMTIASEESLKRVNKIFETGVNNKKIFPMELYSTTTKEEDIRVKERAEYRPKDLVDFTITEIDRNQNVDENPFKKLFLYYELIEKKINENKSEWYEIEDNKAVVGKFFNCNDIGGVKGGVGKRFEMPDVLKSIKEYAEKQGKKIDNISIDFLTEYHKKYVITKHKSDIIYGTVIKILDSTNLTAFKIANEFVLKMKEYAGNIKDEKHKNAATKIVNNSRSMLENVMKEEYVKSIYEEDNEEIKVSESLELRKKLVSEFGGVVGRAKKCSGFFRSFITEDEKRDEETMEKEKNKIKEEKPPVVEVCSENLYKESNYEVLARVGNGMFGSGATNGVSLTIREAHEKGLVNLDDYRKNA